MFIPLLYTTAGSIHENICVGNVSVIIVTVIHTHINMTQLLSKVHIVNTLSSSNIQQSYAAEKKQVEQANKVKMHRCGHTLH